MGFAAFWGQVSVSWCLIVLRGLDRTPLLPLDPPQSGIPISRTLELWNLLSNPSVEYPISRNTRFFKSIFVSLGFSKNQFSTVQSKGPEEARTQTPRTPVIGPSIKLPNTFCWLQRTHETLETRKWNLPDWIVTAAEFLLLSIRLLWRLQLFWIANTDLVRHLFRTCSNRSI